MKTIVNFPQITKKGVMQRSQSIVTKKNYNEKVVTAQHDELRNFLTEPLNDESTDVWLKIQSHRFFPFRILLAAPRTLKLLT